MTLIPSERIENRIYIFRDKKVMLDRDLASLYGVSTKVFKQSIKRNRERFPEDFMFEINNEELKNWRSQFVTSNSDRMGLRHRPFVFTEHGIAMLSSILNSPRAITINIQIIRAFIRLRELAIGHEDILRRIESMEKHYDQQFKIVFDALRKMFVDEEERPEIGYKAEPKT